MSKVINEFGQKKAYSFNQATGEFLGVVWADPDPMREGEYLLPAHSTFTILDDAEAGFVATFIDGNKEIKTDDRGAEYWDEDGTKHTITELGEEVPEGALLEEPPEPEPTDEELASAARLKRDSLISEMSWRYERHASELRLGIDVTDSIESLDTYAQALRDITEQDGFPTVINWPAFEGSN